MPLQQTTFEKIVTKVDIAQNEQFILLLQCFQLFSVIIPTFIELFRDISSFQSQLLQICCMFERVNTEKTDNIPIWQPPHHMGTGL